MARDDGFVRYTLRIPEALYARIQQAAGMRSVNAEIVGSLEEKYPAPDFDFALHTIKTYILKTPRELRKDLLRIVFKHTDDDQLELLLTAFENEEDKADLASDDRPDS